MKKTLLLTALALAITAIATPISLFADGDPGPHIQTQKPLPLPDGDPGPHHS